MAKSTGNFRQIRGHSCQVTQSSYQYISVTNHTIKAGLRLEVSFQAGGSGGSRPRGGGGGWGGEVMGGAGGALKIILVPVSCLRKRE